MHLEGSRHSEMKPLDLRSNPESSKFCLCVDKKGPQPPHAFGFHLGSHDYDSLTMWSYKVC